MRRRVLLSILLVIAATVITLGVPLSVISWRVVDDLVHRDLQTRLETIAVSIANQSASSGLDLGQLEAAVPPSGRLDIRMAGRIDQSIGPPLRGETTSAQLVMAGGGLLRLAVPQDHLRTEQWTALALVGLAVLLSVVVGTGVALLLAGRLVTPLSDLARRSARLGAGDFRTFRRRYGIGELDRVADVLDTSARDIAALISRERDLAGDISHQLRTRLTGLRLSLEELADHDDPRVAEEIRAALEQTDRLVTVVDDLLANARAERAAGAGEVELADELAEIDAEWEPRLVEAGRTLLVRCPRNVVVRATPGRLREALAVLVENSLRHGAGPVEIGVRTVGRRHGDMVVVEVGDQGPGIPTALVSHVFERGVSTASSSGIGLGLARAFVEADGGRLELRRAAPPVFAIFLRRAGDPGPASSPIGAAEPASSAGDPVRTSSADAVPDPAGRSRAGPSGGQSADGRSGFPGS